MTDGKGKQTKQDADTPVQAVLRMFFRRYLTERDEEGTLAMLSDQVICIGTGDGEVAIGKDSFRLLFRREKTELPYPIRFTMHDYVERERVPGCWDCFCTMENSMALPDGAQVLYHMRLTVTLHQAEEGYLIDTLHTSEMNPCQESGGFFPLKCISQDVRPLSQETQQDLMEIIGQVMPGGIVGGYMEKGLPLYVANDQLLVMAGYESYEAFERDIQGMVINTVHPEDRAYVSKQMTRKVAAYGDQYEVEYRMKKRDGSYFWVHNIGRMTIAADGRSAIISILTDISQQVRTKNCLEFEAFNDPLTKLYNRRGCQIQIARRMPAVSNYLFLMMDLDNFKRVNDIYGHKQGDQVLCAFARQLTEFFRKSDVVCRFGGDEFAVFVGDCPDFQVIRHKVELLISAYQTMLQEQWPEAKSTLSVGGIYSGICKTFNELYQLADEALYQVKRTQKGTLNIQILE